MIVKEKPTYQRFNSVNQSQEYFRLDNDEISCISRIEDAILLIN